MTHSTDLNDLAAALVRFQTNLRPVPRNATGEDGKRYADVAAIRKHVKRRLKACKLAVVQFAGWDKVETVILHTSGQWIAHETNLTTIGGDPAYGPRYALLHALGVVQEPESETQTRETLGAAIMATRFLTSEADVAIKLMQNLGLSNGQMSVLLRKHNDLNELETEAEKMAGTK